MTVKSSLLFSGKVSDHCPMVVAGDGNYLTLEDPTTKKRRVVFDAMGGAAVAALGHGDQEITEAMCDAAKTSSYTFPAAITNYAAEELAKFLIEKSPEGAFASALFTCSGSETNENGMKTVYQYFREKGEPQRTKFISRTQSYHGYTLGALALGDSTRSAPFAPITLSREQTPKVSQVYPYRHQKEGESEEAYVARLVQELDDAIVAAGADQVAAVMMETLGGSTFGTSPSLPGYLAGVRKVCDKYGVLMWLDEVMCGIGRASATGGLHCWESFPDFKGPDLQSIGKTLGSGFVTIAGLLVSPKVHQVFVEGSNIIPGAQTYHQHQFNCQVALAVQKKIDRLNLRQNSFDKGMKIGELLKELSKDTKIVGNVRGLGNFWSIELVKDKATKEPFPIALGVGPKISAKALENGMTCLGLQCTVDGTIGDHATVAPTFIINDEEVEFIAKTLIKSVKDVEADLIAAGEL